MLNNRISQFLSMSDLSGNEKLLTLGSWLSLTDGTSGATYGHIIGHTSSKKFLVVCLGASAYSPVRPDFAAFKLRCSVLQNKKTFRF